MDRTNSERQARWRARQKARSEAGAGELAQAQARIAALESALKQAQTHQPQPQPPPADTSREVIRLKKKNEDLAPSLGIIAHTRKPGINERTMRGRALLNTVSGSYVLGAIPRTVWVLQSASDDVNETQVVVTCCKNNDGPLGDRSVWERDNGIWSPVAGFDWDAFDNPVQPGKNGKGSAITDQVMAEVFQFGYLALERAEVIAALMKLTGKSEATCYRAFDRFKYRLSYDKKTKKYSWKK